MLKGMAKRSGGKSNGKGTGGSINLYEAVKAFASAFTVYCSQSKVPARQVNGPKTHFTTNMNTEHLQSRKYAIWSAGKCNINQRRVYNSRVLIFVCMHGSSCSFSFSALFSLLCFLFSCNVLPKVGWHPRNV